MRVALSPATEVDRLASGREVRFNATLNLVVTVGFKQVSELVKAKEMFNTDRVFVVAHAGKNAYAGWPSLTTGAAIHVGDPLLLDIRSGFVFERIPEVEIVAPVLKEVPDMHYGDIGGLIRQI